ncbi:MAG TPA: SRPBCC domain-containing protein [Candidatus Thermoplasmatota archaeon]|nr:SRPBCC domain-containing protein [Candidatus Thermoplasmatota archaeon]
MTNKTSSHLPPPRAPEGKPFEVGATTALVTTTPDHGVTLRLKRVINASPEKIYKAFLDADALSAWLPPHGFVAKMHSFEPKVGGKFRMSFYTVTKSWENTFGGIYLELVPNKKIVHTDKFESDDPAMQGEMKVTIVLTAQGDGTLVEIVQEGIPAMAASGAPYGWSQSLDKLANLVEPELPF